MQLQSDFEELLSSVSVSAAKVAAYASDQATSLAALVGKPGYHEAVIAARDSIALQAGIVASDQADIANSKILGLLEGALYMGAKVLAGVA
jgi:hypothetical protein